MLMDAMMPDLDGNETTRRIRAQPAVRGPAGRVPDREGDARRPGVQPRRRAPATTSPSRSTWTSCSTLMASWVDRRRAGDAHDDGDRGMTAAGPRCCWSTTGGRTCSPWRRSCRGCRSRSVAVDSGEDGAQAAAGRRLRADPARRADAGHGRLRDRRAHQAPGADPAHADHLPDRGRPRRRTWPSAATGGRGRLPHQAVRPVGAAGEGVGVRRAVDDAARSSRRGPRSASAGGGGGRRAGVAGRRPRPRRPARARERLLAVRATH